MNRPEWTIAPYDDLIGWSFAVLAVIALYASWQLANRAYREHGVLIPSSRNLSGRAVLAGWMFFIGLGWVVATLRTYNVVEIERFGEINLGIRLGAVCFGLWMVWRWRREGLG